MIAIDPKEIADLIGAEIVSRGESGHPVRAEIDSRRIEGGELFFGLPGERTDGGEFAGAVLEAGAWGAVVATRFASDLTGVRGWVFATEDPLAGLQALAGAWRRRLDAGVVGITGSVGKTSVKDMVRAILPGEVHATEENFNTEIGMPLTILAAPEGTDYLVLEMAMRGSRQISELAAIAEPDVGVITNVGPVHVELLGSVEAVAAAKAEVIDGVRSGGTVVAQADAGLLEPHLERAGRLLRFGEGGDVEAASVETGEDGLSAVVSTPVGRQRFDFPFPERHNLDNALAAIAAGVALGVDPAEMSARTGRIRFSRLRGERVEIDHQVLLLNDCYNANPVSMRAALDHLAVEPASTRIAVLGLMGELGAEADRFHREVGEYAREVGVDVVIGVGEEAAGYGPDRLVDDPVAAAGLVREMATPGTVVLVKGSRSAGLEAVAESLVEGGS